MKYSVILVAGGQGTRMGLGYNKVFYPLEKGQTVLDKALGLYLNDTRCAQIIIVTNPNDLLRTALEYEAGRIVNVSGGKTRQDSVFSALMAVTEETVLIHDAARPYTPQSIIDNIIIALESESAAVPVIPVHYTIKETSEGYVDGTLDRNVLRHAQSPQGFKTELFLRCLHKARLEHFEAEDDAHVVETFSDLKIKIVEGSFDNVKITTLDDIR
jgi:2-C-methyl-D-erythritol 4-phosphate cytidylyltransferase